MEAAVRRVSRCAQMARVHRIDTRSDTESDAETSKLLGPSGASAAASPQRMLPTFFTPAKELSSGKTIHSDADASEVAFRAKLGAAVLSKIMRRRVCRRPRAPALQAASAYEKLQKHKPACGATYTPQLPAGCPHKCCCMGAQKRACRLNRARARVSASKGSLAFPATLLAVLASALEYDC